LVILDQQAKSTRGFTRSHYPTNKTPRYIFFFFNYPLHSDIHHNTEENNLSLLSFHHFIYMLLSL